MNTIVITKTPFGFFVTQEQRDSVPLPPTAQLLDAAAYFTFMNAWSREPTNEASATDKTRQA